MKKIEAIIRESKVEPVRAALKIAGIEGLTVVRAEGFGLQKGRTINYRSVEKRLPDVPRAKLEIIVPEDQWIDAVGVIDHFAHTGDAGDGRIMVIDLEYAFRIGRHGECEPEKTGQPQAVTTNGISRTLITPVSPQVSTYSASRT